MQIHEIMLREAPNSAFGQIAKQLQQPLAPSQSSTGGTVPPTAKGLTHTASLDNPNPRTTPATQQQLWDREYRRLTNQFPGLKPEQYQAAMVKRMGATRPAGGAPQPTVAPQQTKVAPAQPAPQQTKVAPTVDLPQKQYPPITLGTGPKAQVFVNKGRGYVDSKTGKPMPPAIVKAMGLT
jgi:hypothetical protein